MNTYKIKAIIITTIFFLLPFVLFYLMDGQSGVELSDYPPTELQEETFRENQMEQQIYRPY